MKKHIALIIGLLFAVSVFSGCSEKSHFTSEQSNTSESAQQKELLDNGVKEAADKITNKGKVTEKNEDIEEPETVKEGEQYDVSSDYKVDLLDSMTSSQKRELNLFLSNFSEAHYMTYYINEIDEKVSFAYIHDLVNNKGAHIVRKDGKYMISASGVDTILTRFFGSSISHRTPGDGSRWVYADGYYAMPAADGESYSYFSTAVNIADNGDGTQTADFNVYTNIQGPHDPIDSSCYSLTDREAAASYEYCYSGSAVLRPKNHNGSATYEIVSYSVYQ